MPRETGPWFLTQQQDLQLSDEDKNQNSSPVRTTESSKPSLLCFPTEFPYEFDSICSSSSSALTSPADSTTVTIISDGDVSRGGCDVSRGGEVGDGEDFFAGLTRRLTQQLALKPEKKWVMSGSPESTLSGLGTWSVSSNGSPNGVLSPPTTPFGVNNDSSWDMIPDAAREVGRLQMRSNEVDSSKRISNLNNFNTHIYQERGSLAPPKSKGNGLGFYSSQSLGHGVPLIDQYQHQVREGQTLKPQWSREQMMATARQAHPQQLQGTARLSTGYESARSVRPYVLRESSWPPLRGRAIPQQRLHNHQQLAVPQTSAGTRAFVLRGSGAKKECAGTGVFLPRTYDTAPEYKKQPACPMVRLPAKVVQALNLNIDDLATNNHIYSNLSNAPSPDYNVLMARRNLLLSQQKKTLQLEVSHHNLELSLPQEWTY